MKVFYETDAKREKRLKNCGENGGQFQKKRKQGLTCVVKCGILYRSAFPKNGCISEEGNGTADA